MVSLSPVTSSSTSGRVAERAGGEDLDDGALGIVDRRDEAVASRRIRCSRPLLAKFG
jgi:hypothetical protein